MAELSLLDVFESKAVAVNETLIKVTVLLDYQLAYVRSMLNYVLQCRMPIVADADIDLSRRD